MKFLGVFLLLAVAVSCVKAEELSKENFEAIASACKEEEGASDDDLEAIKKHLPTESKEGKCTRACVMKKFGLMTAEGKLDHDIAIVIGQHMIKEEDKKDLAATIVEACESLEVDADHCEAAAQYGGCIKQQIHELGLAESEEL